METGEASNIVQYVIDDSSDEVEEVEEIQSTQCSTESELALGIGILEESLKILKQKSDFNNQNAIKNVCGLLIGEIKLTQKYEKYQGKVFGYTEGMGKTPLHEPKKMASKAVIFMVISWVENWKIPVGLFFVHNPDIKYFADLIEETLTRLDAIDIDIISITLNCVSPHLSFALAEELGAELDTRSLSNMKPCFSHPSENGKQIYILYDINIIIGYLKNFWKQERILLLKTSKGRNKMLDYALITDVKKITESQLQSYGSQVMYDWIIIRKRLSYDTEDLGKYTAHAMQYLKDLKHPDFQNCGATAKFIRVLDLMKEISKINGSEEELHPNLSEVNENKWKPLIINIVNYMSSLKSTTQNKDHRPCSQHFFRLYVNGTWIYFRSLLDIYHDYVKAKTNGGLDYLLPDRFGLRHIRLGLLDNVEENMNLSALNLFKKMQQFTKKFHPIH